MKKKTINAILTGVNIVLVIAIVILIVKISTRQPMTEETMNNNTPNQDTTELVDNTETEIAENNTIEQTPVEKTLIAVPHSTTSVNVRSGPGTEYDRIGSAYTDCEYEIIEVLDSGWTKLYYDGMEGYISSEFLSYKYMITSADGTVSYEDVSASQIQTVADTTTPSAESTVENNNQENNNQDNSDSQENSELE